MIMTPEHPKWQEFCSLLEGSTACDFHEEIPGKRDTLTWKCNGGRDKTFASRILNDLGGIDIFNP